MLNTRSFSLLCYYLLVHYASSVLFFRSLSCFCISASIYRVLFQSRSLISSWLTTSYCQPTPTSTVPLTPPPCCLLTYAPFASAAFFFFCLFFCPASLNQGCSGAGTRGTASPHFFLQGDASPTLPTFLDWNSCCNWLLTETQCKIISVQQN